MMSAVKLASQLAGVLENRRGMYWMNLEVHNQAASLYQWYRAPPGISVTVM